VKVFYLASIGSIEPEILEASEICLWHTFGFEVGRTDMYEIPPEAFDGKRMQYSSIEILKMLNRRSPKDATRVLGITQKDLFIPVLSFVYGHAQFEGKVGVVSTARLRQEFYGFPPDQSLLTARVLKEIVHETGHLFGLTHCNDVGCPMSLSTNIRALDRKGVTLCGSCSILLKENMTEKSS
jgi:archaemetzincin